MPVRPSRRSLLRVLGRRLPQTEGTLRVSGPRAQVSVARDRHGVPHIDAAGAEDAWFALGFVQGQDRGFQLEILLRAGRGTLAELLGPEALPIDRLSRTLGFRRLADEQLGLLDDDVRSALSAYVAGVNAGAAVTPRPHELAILRARPTPWEQQDCLAFVGLQSLALNGNWDSELARAAILLTDGPDALAAIDPPYAPWLPATIPVGAAAGQGPDRRAADRARLEDLQSGLERLRGLAGGAGASNAWAIAGSRTATGKPILANDPHLAPAIPAPWYLVHLRTPEWEVAGCAFVGGPAIPTGHTGGMAWGITAACTDSSDLFWEEIDLERRTARGPDGPEPVEVLREEIAVRGAPSVIEEVVVTARGPIVSRALDGAPASLSMRATWLQPSALRGFLGILGAEDLEGFRDAFAAWAGPALNVVFADAAGHVGWQLVGHLPVRRAGNGTLPLPAWDPRVGWEAEHLPFAAMPSCIDPDAGFIASANNAPRTDAPDAPFLGADWLDGYRAARIVEVLSSRTDWDVPSSQALQLDTTSVPWSELREMVIDAAATSAEEDVSVAHSLLAGWDGRVEAGSAAASVYELTLVELAERMAKASAPNGWRHVLSAGFGTAVPRTAFGARIASRVVAGLRAHEDRSGLVRAALAAAVSRLRATAGTDPTGWAWGSVRPLRLLHLFGARRPLDAIFNVGPVAAGGDTNTVPQAGVVALDPFANPTAIATHRTVIDLGDPERSRFVVAGGQSGNPLSIHYDDLFAIWQRGEGVPIPWSHDSVVAATRHTLLLRPTAR
jgi:penicillin amidase